MGLDRRPEPRRDNDRDLLAEGPEVLKTAAKRSRELDMALSTWGDVTFDFESTDTPGVTPESAGADGRLTNADHPGDVLPSARADRRGDHQSAWLRARPGLGAVGGVHRRPTPRNHYWDMWGLPMFDLLDAAGVLHEINACRQAYPDRYIRVYAYDSRRGRQTVALAFLVNRPAAEPGFRLARQEGADRRLRYTIHPYALDRPAGARYGP